MQFPHNAEPLLYEYMTKVLSDYYAPHGHTP